MAKGRRPRREPLPAVAGAIGVTRVARLTGLDRTGVEVASAIRPTGHVLQVTNGKGERFVDAALGALMEAAELDAAERSVAETWDTSAALASRLGADGVLSAAALDPSVEPGWEGVRLAWRSGEDLLSGRRVLVPAHAIHVSPPGATPLGPALLRWTSNGMGAAFTRTRALLHALLEVAERDRVARALPDGFTPGEIARRLLDPATLGRAAPRAAALAARIEARGLRVHLLDLGISGRRQDGGVPLPCATALLVEEEHGPVPVAAGYACRVGRDAALRAALLEAAQSRATEIHGAREDVDPGDRRGALALARLCARARPSRDVRAMADAHASSVADALRLVLAGLRRAGARQAVAVDLAAAPGLAVVKVLVPGLLLSELLR